MQKDDEKLKRSPSSSMKHLYNNDEKQKQTCIVLVFYDYPSFSYHPKYTHTYVEYIHTPNDKTLICFALSHLNASCVDLL